MGVKGIYLRSERMRDFYRDPVENEEKCKNMRNYLRIRKKSSNFALSFRASNKTKGLYTKQIQIKTNIHNGRKQRIES